MGADDTPQDPPSSPPASDPGAPCPADAGKPFDPKKEADAFLTSARYLDNAAQGHGVEDTAGGTAQLTLHQETLHYLVEHKMLIAMGNDGYVIPGVGNAKSEFILIVDEKGAGIGAIANEGMHDWTPDYVQRYILNKDAEIANSSLPARDYKPTDTVEKRRYKEILAHAGHNPGDARLVIDTSGVYEGVSSQRSQEGHNYISIPRAELLQALSSDEGMRKMEAAIDTQSAEIKKRSYSLDAYVQRHDIDMLKASGTTIDDKVYLPQVDSDNPEFNVKISDAALKTMTDSHQVNPLRQSDLDPDIADRIARRVNADGLPADTPVYVMAGVNAGVGTDNSPSYEVLQTKTEKPYILVDEKALRPTPDYVRQYRMNSDSDILSDTKIESAGTFKPDADKAAAYKTLLDRVAGNANAAHAPVLLINHHAAADNVASEQSRTGQDYIYISQKRLDQALSSPQEMQKLYQSLDEEQAFIKNGGNSALGLIARDKAGRFIAANSPIDKDTQESKTQLPNPSSDDSRLDPAVIQQLVKSGAYVECKRSEILPEAFSGMDASIAKDAPVYVMSGVTNDAGSGSSKLMFTSEGKPYVLIDESVHKWTEAYVTDHIDQGSDSYYSNLIAQRKLSSGDDAIEKVRKGECSEAESRNMQAHYQSLTAAVAQNSKTLKSSPFIMVDNTEHAVNSGGPGNAVSATTQEGTNYIIISKSLFDEAMKDPTGEKSKQLNAIMGHECGHIRDGDTLPAGMAKAHNIIASRQQELLADLTGGGPLGGHSARDSAREFEDDLRTKYLQQHPDSGLERSAITPKMLEEASRQDVRDNPASDHPAYWDRIVALKYEAQMMDQYEAEHKKPFFKTRAAMEDYNKKESEYVIRQTLDYMKDKYEYPMTEVQTPAGAEKEKAAQGSPDGPKSAAPSLTDSQHAEIHAIQKTMGRQQAAEAALPTSAPHAAVIPPQPSASAIAHA